jgi:N-acetylglucosamine kinase-like BadF-type ATPase
LAGLDTQHDREILTALAVDALQASAIQTNQLFLENDGMMTLIGATGGSDGVLIIAGTGSIACGVTSDGRRARVGGWGSRAGDEGSGYCIGMSALRHVLRAVDGREQQSGICAAILQEKGMVDVEELINWIYGSDFAVDSVAAIAPDIFSLAEGGDRQASMIVATALNELSLMAATVIKQLGLNDSTLHTILTGGVLQKNSRLREQLAQYIQVLAPKADFAPPVYPPIVGGVLLGLQASGVVTSDSLQRITASLS